MLKGLGTLLTIGVVLVMLVRACGTHEPRAVAPRAAAVAPPVAGPESEPTPTAKRATQLEHDFLSMDTDTVMQNVSAALAVKPPTEESIQEASIGLASIRTGDRDRGDVKKANELLKKRVEWFAKHDPGLKTALHEAEASPEAVRQGVVEVLREQLVGAGLAESIEQLPANAVAGPTLLLHAEKCNQTLVNMVKVRLGQQLRGAGFMRVQCRGGAAWLKRESTL